MRRMINAKLRDVFLAAVLAFCFARPVHAGPILLNGSFELGPDIPTNDILIADGSSEILGWLVIGGTIDYLGPPWDVSDGFRAIDLNGRDSVFSGIQQTFATTVGQAYTVSFDFAGNPQGLPDEKSLRVAVDGFSRDYLHNVTGQTIGQLQWQTATFSFQASGPTSTLSFLSSSHTPTSYGPLIDNVEVHSVPESPSALIMIAAALAIACAQRLKPTA
jgi:choice-of-anchor C domain-containing protein